MVKKIFSDLFIHVPNSAKRNVMALSFTRFGGVSNPPFNELNVSTKEGDCKENVLNNLKIIKKITGLKKIVFLNQTHGTNFLHYVPERQNFSLEADGIFTTVPDIGLMIKHADCQAVVMYDPVKKVIANIHCGWRGSAAGILSKAVTEFKEVYGSNPSDLFVGISPSLGPCCGEFKDWKKKLPKWIHKFRIKNNHINFWSASIYELKKFKIPMENIYCSKICTVCNKDYFSYRREGKTGRLATIIALKTC